MYVTKTNIPDSQEYSNDTHKDETQTTNTVSPITTSTLAIRTGLDAETRQLLDQHNHSPASEKGEEIRNRTTTASDAETSIPGNHSKALTSGLDEKPDHTQTDLIDTSSADLNDKIDPAQGLLLLGTDVSSADDSQEPPELRQPASLRDETALHDEKCASSNDSDNTIIADTTEVPIQDNSVIQDTPNTTSPRKGVLNLRQIGIKRHRPVDSSHPSAIGSPPGSPDTKKTARDQRTPLKNVIGNNENQQIHNKGTTHARNKNKSKGYQTNNSATKDKVSRPKNPKTSVSHTKPFSARGASAPTSTATTPASNIQEQRRDQFDTGTEGKYSIKRTVISGTIYYCCSYCDKKYDTLHGLNNHHEKTHPPVNCDVCNRSFSTPNSLIHHSYTHLEQSFQCDLCEKSFPFKSQLENHIPVHTQAVKHRCDKCGKTFIRTGEYNIHLRGHANIRIHCPVKGCDYETVDVRNLTSHKKSHTKRISVYCKICGEGFVYHEQRKRHMNKIHT